MCQNAMRDTNPDKIQLDFLFVRLVSGWLLRVKTGNLCWVWTTCWGNVGCETVAAWS